jgi:hypothetical protein
VADIELSRFYPASRDETYAAMVEVVSSAAGRLHSADNFSGAVSFATRMTGWASGANVSAYVIPQDGGTMLRATAQAKMRTQVNANNAAHKQIVEIFDAIGQVIQQNRSLAAEIQAPRQAGWHPDPWRQGSFRYHDGTHWTSHLDPGSDGSG